MISIKTTDGQELNLQVDLRLSIEETSVFEGKQGSYSLPLELPYTAHNAQVLGLPSNIARKQRFTTSVDVIIAAGVWIRYAKMEVSEVTYGQSIQCTLFLKESPFYSKIEGLEIPDVFKEKVVDLNPGMDAATKLQQLITHMEDVAIGRTVADYFVFPVCAEIQEIEQSKPNAIYEETLVKRWTRFKILNMQVTPDANNEFGAVSNYNGKDYYVLAGTAYEYEDNNVAYTMPIGYGITPFLKFTYILRYLFSHLGYTLVESIFDTDISFQKMCLLNNTIDAIVAGVIDYAQLVPDVSVSEFFEFVENSFGCEFVIDEMHKTATPRFWNDVLNSRSDLNLSGKFEDYPQLTYTPAETVKLTVERSNKATTPITFDSFVDLFAEYGQPIYKQRYSTTVDEMQQQGVMDGTFFYYFADLFCYMIFKDGYMGRRFVVEKDTLDYYDSSPKLQLKEIKTGFEAVAMENVATGGVTGVRVDYNITLEGVTKEQRESMANIANSLHATEDRLIAKMPFIDGSRNLNTVVQKTQKKGNSEIVSEEEEGEVSLPIMPCFYYGLADYDANMTHLNRTIFGTTHRYSNRGVTWGTFDLTTKSLFERFWQKYDRVVRSSYHSISGPAHLSTSEVMKLEFDKQCLLDNQTVLASSIQYEVSDNGIEVTNLAAKTTKVYE